MKTFKIISFFLLILYYRYFNINQNKEEINIKDENNNLEQNNDNNENKNNNEEINKCYKRLSDKIYQIRQIHKINS